MPHGTNLAAGQPGPGAGDCQCEVVDWPVLCSERDAWKALSNSAVEPNVFYDPDFAMPAAEALGLAGQLKALMMWRTGEGSGAGTRRLVGMFPFVERRRWAVPLTVGTAFIHPYATSSAPLVDPAERNAVMSLFFDWFASAPHAPAAWMFRLFPGDGPLREDLEVHAERSGTLLRPFFDHGRAVLDTGTSGPGYLEEALSGKARKEYGRLRRRLAEHGEVSLTRATAASDVEAAMTEFLALEVAGWKGRRGTAAAKSAPIASMFRQIAARLAASGQIRIDAMRLEGTPVAMFVTCLVDGHWWLWKTTYDETYARLSPGVLLVLDLTGTALRERERVHYDSCAVPGHPMIDRIWRQRRPYADLLLVKGRPGGMQQTTLSRLESLRRTAEQAARDIRRMAMNR